jgi:hypothetical protein
MQILFKGCYLLLSILCYCKHTDAQSVWAPKENNLPTQWDKSVNPQSVLPEYPRPQMKREKWQSLNGLWDYAITSKESSPESFEGKILVPFPVQSSLSGVKRNLLPGEFLWYNRKLQFKKGRATDHILLHFGAVDWKATLYVNGSLVGSHQGGYTGFSFDISKFLVDGTNNIALKVIDSTDLGLGPHGKQVLSPGNIYYTPVSGIWQTVWLEEVPQVYIEDLEVTPDIDKSSVTVKVNLNRRDTSNYTVAFTSSGGISAKGYAGRPFNVKIRNERLWSPSDPYLYDFKVIIKKSGFAVDSVESYFGMRKISIGKDGSGNERIFLNNKFTYNLGVLDQGYWPDGLYTAPTDSALQFDILASKAMGFNTIRKHIKIEPMRWYYYADKIGVLVWQDFVNPSQQLVPGAKEEFIDEVTATIKQLRNEPCVVTWVVFNERWGMFEQKKVTEMVRALDPTRLVNGHSGELLYLDDKLRDTSSMPYISSHLTDVHSYPFPRMPLMLAGKAMVVGEFGGVASRVGNHVWDKSGGWGYNGLLTPEQLKHSYESMVDSLVILEKLGLSGSIYTQPFDVETELNGIFSYDRAVAKIPDTAMRRINSKLLPGNGKFSELLSHFTIATPQSLLKDYRRQVDSFQFHKSDPAFLRRLAQNALIESDTLVIKSTVDQYCTLVKDLLSTSNIVFLKDFVFASDAAFKFYLNHRKTIDSILGANAAENLLMATIFNKAIKPEMQSSNPDFNQLEATIARTYGELGMERLWAAEVGFYLDKKDWIQFGKYLKLYFDASIPDSRSILNINNLSYYAFLNVNDVSVLESVIKAVELNLKVYEANNAESIDTYANLLYKVGRIDDAIKWETAAVQISGGGGDFASCLQKMRSGAKTW